MGTNNSKLVLASGSPRRMKLLKEIHPQFEVAPSSIEEIMDIGFRPEENARNIARAKAESIAPNFPDCWVIGADTLVSMDDEIFQKPEDEKDAERILKRLSGREHLVVTGICVVSPKKTLDKSVISKVKIKVIRKQIHHFPHEHQKQMKKVYIQVKMKCVGSILVMRVRILRLILRNTKIRRRGR